MASEDVLQEIVRNATPLTQCITLSTAYMTEADSVILARMSRHSRTEEGGSDEWIIDREYGFLLQLTQREKRLEMLRKEGISAALYLLLASLTNGTGIGFVLFDRDERITGNSHTFDW